jgi:prepilin-type N-terminal cleavage/methylation domain-containing protein
MVSIMKKFINNSQGFTLIELIVSVAILGFVVVGFLNLFVYGTTYLSMARDKSTSSTIALSDANELMSASNITSSNIVTSSAYELIIELTSGNTIDPYVTEVTVQKTEDGQESTIVTIVP